MIDLAVIRERNGHSGATTLEEAATVFEATGDRRYIPEVQRARRTIAGIRSPAPVSSLGPTVRG